MKLGKRIVALLVALMLVVGIFAMTAAAYSCSYCGKTASVAGYGSWSTGSSTVVNGCEFYSGLHTHYTRSRSVTLQCSHCGRKSYTTQTEYNWCPYA